MHSWKPMEFRLDSDRDYRNGYIDVTVDATFTHASGEVLHRPAFWDGGRTWRVRFAPTRPGEWTWRATCSDVANAGLQTGGSFRVVDAASGASPFERHGLLRMSPGRRNAVHADGTPVMLVGDTAWGLPWRATEETAAVYAEDRQRKGFNCSLLMTVLPDQDAVGPRDRVSPNGFDVGFEDLPAGHLNQLNPGYFQTMDRLMAVLLDHGIIPIYQPVFQGYGWKGLRPLGREADPVEYARYCRYLVARYGASPAIWLVSADGTGLDPCVEAGGRAIFAADAYHQPLGIHYSPFDGADADSRKYGQSHGNKSHQDAPWLDFQWCQSGHSGVSNTSKVRLMHDNKPTKGVANAEPAYEGIGEPTRAAGWWQGNEAWANLTAGGTMGVFYGVAALWQWKHVADEWTWPDWGKDNVNWRDALDLPGSTFVGHVGKALKDYDFADMTRLPDSAGGRACVGVPGKFYCVYLPEGGEVTLSGIDASLPFRWFDPKAGTWAGGGMSEGKAPSFKSLSNEPWVLIAGKPRSS